MKGEKERTAGCRIVQTLNKKNRKTPGLVFPSPRERLTSVTTSKPDPGWTGWTGAMLVARHA